jgi:tetratricopeptide (TPR) repeat protein
VLIQLGQHDTFVFNTLHYGHRITKITAVKKLTLILILLLTAGCGRSLKSGWTNFSAYYNTFYNAKQDYRAGLKQVKKQPVQINPNEPVRPHPAPVLAGGEDFEQAIANAAQMLRRFSDSKWTDDALLLIGQSYYYRQEFFLAIQKFEEVMALPMRTPVRQKAVIWKGRTMLDIASYNEGVSFLEERLATDDLEWNPGYRAEAQIVLAEHYAMLEQWNGAAALLERALLQVENQKLKGRGYYLLGQLLQQADDFGRAFQAYTNVERNFPDYEYIYWAEIKRAEVSRLQGNAALAVSLYGSMLRDDKNAERRDEIHFQLARTFETLGKYRDAETAYERVLRNPSNTASGTLLADTYYRMGRMYSEQYGNYEAAAAYFDSSTTQNRNQIRIKDDDQTARLATAYSSYTDLKNDISRIDSLLRLGSLSDEALQAELAGIRRQREEQLQNSPNRVQQANNLLVNTQDEVLNESTVSEERPSLFGFLNYKDPQRVKSGRRRFVAVWGDRPLTDNWRRREAISGTSFTGRRSSGASPDANADQGGAGQPVVLASGIDAAGIPRTVEAQNELKTERVQAQYQLGTLFFLSLDQPDSADVYYRRVLTQQQLLSRKLRAQTLYSLYELYNLQEQPDSAARYKSQILQDYPYSPFAKRIQDGAEAEQEQTQNREADLRRTFKQLRSETNLNLPNKALADSLRALAVNNSASPLAPHIYFEALKMYIRNAKRDTVQQEADSLRIASEGGTYAGPRWERVRRGLSEFKELFPEAPQAAQLNTWQTVLGPPKE